jgi:hypothetical protein
MANNEAQDEKQLIRQRVGCRELIGLHRRSSHV